MVLLSYVQIGWKWDRFTQLRSMRFVSSIFVFVLFFYCCMAHGIIIDHIDQSALSSYTFSKFVKQEVELYLITLRDLDLILNSVCD